MLAALSAHSRHSRNRMSIPNLTAEPVNQLTGAGHVWPAPITHGQLPMP
jgi:hypothetical protein